VYLRLRERERERESCVEEEMEITGSNSTAGVHSNSRKRVRFSADGETGEDGANPGSKAALLLQVQELTVANKNMAKKLRRAEDRIWVYELEQKSHENELKRVEAEHKEALEKAQKHKEALEKAEKRRSSVEEGARKLLAKVQRHERSIPELERQTNEVLSAKERFAAESAEREVLLECEMNSLKQDLQTCEKRCSRFQAENVMLQHRVGELQGQLKDAYQNKDSAEYELRLQADVRDHALCQVNVLEANLQRANAMYKEEQGLKTRLQAQNRELTERNLFNRNQVSMLGAEVVRYQRNETVLRQIISGLKSNIITLEQEERRKSITAAEDSACEELARKRAAELDDVTTPLAGTGKLSSPTAEECPDDETETKLSLDSLALVDSSIEKSWKRLCQVLDFYRTTIGDTSVHSPTAVLGWFRKQLEEYRFIDSTDLNDEVKRSLLVNRLGLFTVLEHTLIDLVSDKRAKVANESADSTTTIKAIIDTALEVEGENEIECVKKDPDTPSPSVGAEVVLDRNDVSEVLR